MTEENSQDPMTMSKGKKEQKELEKSNPTKLSVEEFNKQLMNLRYQCGYNYEESQRYFKRVHNMDRDDFEMMSAKADELSE